MLLCMKSEPSFVTVQSRGVIAIPSAIRRQLGLDRPGAQVEVIERDGEIVLRPHVPVPSDQVWFWEKRWQKMEREADEAVGAGRVATFENVDDFLDDLDS
jgi:AbrB family looped-hinge helix DNA binding protein